MDPWFFREPGRLTEERARVEALASSAAWLVGFNWRFDPDFCLDAIVAAHGHEYTVRVEFPPYYPDVPAIVRPKNYSVRLSGHQYGGADGPLCLEWGPDNWHRGITAADLLESAHRLFDIENPLGSVTAEEVAIAPSRHQLSVGQEIRPRLLRWYAGLFHDEFLPRDLGSRAGWIRFSLRICADSWIVLIHEAAALGGATWADRDVPQSLPGGRASERSSGVWIRTEADATAL
ncbi:MAG: hypothetical protein IPJ57_09980 [Gemmatimonadetes bacterium]|nr:hypothetical protein [Gemmatimonadota bacterium]MBK7784807.1 hypothetical protein [Gemmatimonadota bacterium]